MGWGALEMKSCVKFGLGWLRGPLERSKPVTMTWKGHVVKRRGRAEQTVRKNQRQEALGPGTEGVIPTPYDPAQS